MFDERRREQQGLLGRKWVPLLPPWDGGRNLNFWRVLYSSTLLRCAYCSGPNVLPFFKKWQRCIVHHFQCRKSEIKSKDQFSPNEIGVGKENWPRAVEQIFFAGEGVKRRAPFSLESKPEKAISSSIGVNLVVVRRLFSSLFLVSDCLSA